MLKKQNRISKNKDFDRAFKAGRSFYGKIISLRAVINNLEEDRFGIIISSKVSKKAVERNRLRRIIREEIKKILLNTSTGQDFIIIVRPEANALPTAEIRLIINNLFKKAVKLEKK